MMAGSVNRWKDAVTTYIISQEDVIEVGGDAGRFSPDGRQLLINHPDGRWLIVDLDTGLTTVLPAPPHSVVHHEFVWCCEGADLLLAGYSEPGPDDYGYSRGQPLLTMDIWFVEAEPS